MSENKTKNPKSYFKKFLFPLFALSMFGGAAKAIKVPEGAELSKTSSKGQRKSAEMQDSNNSLIKGKAGDLQFQKTLLKGLHPKDYKQARIFGGIALQELEINGEGATVIVYDSHFEKDSLTNFFEFESPYFFVSNPNNNIMHGNRVASALASTNPEALGIAAGATIYPITAIRGAPINRSFINNLKRALDDCETKNLPKPRVINMSQGFYVNIDSQDLIEELTDILKKNDMLLVASAGNEGMKGDEEKQKTRSWISVRAKLHELPELAEHVLLVGSFDDLEKKTLSDYSNPAGEQKSHYITTEGFQLHTSVIDGTTGVRKTDKDNVAEGTSFAAPQAAAMAALLGKYFPEYSMKEVKNILLKSALRLKDQDDTLVGHGALNPLQAWIMALEGLKPTVTKESAEETEIRSMQAAFEKMEREQLEAQQRELASQQAELKNLQDTTAEIARLEAELKAQRAQPQPVALEKTGFFKKLFSRFKGE